MILERLTVHGFSNAFRASTAVLDFAPLGPGVYAWCGPNGAGKTTAMETIVAALYREFPSYGYKAASHVAPGVRDAAIELEARITGERYRLRLLCDPLFGGGRGKSEHYVDQEDGPGNWHACAGPNLRDADAAIEHIAPSRDLFLAGPYAAQRGAGSFWSLSRDERKRLFVELLGHGRLQLLHGRASEQAKACGVDLAALTAEVERLNELAIARQDMVDLLAHLAEIKADSIAAADALAGELAEARRAAEDARALADRIAQAGGAAALRRTIEASIADCESSLADMADRLDAPALEALEAAAATARRADVDAGAELESARRIEGGAEARLRDAARAIESAAVRLRDLEAQAAALEGVDLTLDLCRRCPLTAAAQAARAASATLTESLPGAEEERRAAEAALERARLAAAERRATKDGTLEQFDATRLELSDGRRLAERAAQDAARRDKIAGKLSRLRSQLDAAPAAEAPGALEADAPRQLALTSARVLDLEQRARILDDARREAERDHARAEGELAAVDKAIGGADLAEKQDALLRLQRRRRGWQLLDVGLGPNGVQALEIDAAGPEVSALANELLLDTFGPRFQIRLETTRQLKSRDGQAEVFECAVIDAEADHTTHAGSGGEMVIVEEALRLALAIYSTRQSGKECLTLFRDEAAGALDQWEGRDSAGKYLAMLRAARERGGFHHVFVVAHQPALFLSADGRFVFEHGTARYEVP